MSAARLAFGFRAASSEKREMREEMQFHLHMQTQQNVAKGMTLEEARRAAAVTFGRSTHWEEAAGDEIRSAFIDALLRDLRFGMRSLVARPLFAVAAIATLGFGIAASVTAFSFIDSIFLRPLPVPRPDRLYRVYIVRTDGGYSLIGSGGVELLRQHRDIFGEAAADNERNVRFVRVHGALDQRFVSFVSGDFWSMLGLQPLVGRFFGRAEERTPDGDAVAVISASLWHGRFDSDPRIIGEPLQINGRDFTVIGVGPEGFEGIGVGETPSQIWMPTSTMQDAIGGCALRPPCEDSDGLLRLADGVSPRRAEAAVSALARELSRVAIGDDSARKVVMRPASGAVLQKQREFTSLSRLLIAISVVLLLVACANLSGLLIARGVSREREIALRQSLGASRSRIVQQLLCESVIIALGGGVVGMLLSAWTSHALFGVFTSDEEGFPHFFQIGVDGRILIFAIAVSLVTTILFGLLPALITARPDAGEVLKKTGGAAPRGRTRFLLIAGQVALTTALLSGAALLARSFAHLLHAQQFDPTNVAVFRLRPTAANYDSLQSHQFVRAVRDRVAALPGVHSVAFARAIGLAWSNTPTRVGIGAARGDSSLSVEAHVVSPAFFATLRIPVRQGREFGESDLPNSQPVAVVSASVARQLWPRGSALGRAAFVRGRSFRIVGVVPDYAIHSAGESAPFMVFLPFWQHALWPEGDVRFVVRMQSRPDAALAMLRRSVTSVDASVPMTELMTMTAQVDANYPEVHLGQTVLLGTGALSLFLTTIGLYGMIAFLVARRTREIGVRVALGASRGQVVGQFVGQGMRAAVAGLLVGIVAAAGASRSLSAWLIGVAPHDVVAFMLAALAVLVAALLATAIPARRAALVDPAIALRSD